MGIAADIALILVAGLAGGLVAFKLGQPPLIGYIAGGVLVGPNTIGPTVIEIHEIELLAEIGVALLLFALGLEISFRDLKPVRGVAVIGGILQILVTTAFGYGVAVTLLGLEHEAAIWFGGLMSVSSTMVVLRTLMAKGVVNTLASRVMIGILVVQDLAVVPMLILLPELGDVRDGLPRLGRAIVVAGLFLLAMFVVGTKLMPALLRVIARWRSRELFLVAVVALGVGVGYATYLTGLSFAFGAFVAGMVLSESEFSHQALSDVIPLRDVFGLLFFASVGMLFDPRFLVEHLGEVAVAVGVVLAGKALIFAVITRGFGYGNMAPLIVGLGLAQIGEFSFLLAREGLRLGFLDRDAYSLALTTTLATMVVTPLLASLPVPLYRLQRRFVPQERPLETYAIPAGGLRDHVVVVGYGRTGGTAVEVMRRTGLPFVVIEADHARFGDCARGVGPAIWGDATQEPVLQAADIRRAQMLLVTIPDVSGIHMVVERAIEMNPTLDVIARAVSPESLDELARLPIREVVQPELEAGLEMVRQVLARCRYSPQDILRFSDAVHREVYAPFRERRSSEDGLAALEDLRRAAREIAIEWMPVAAGSPVAGRTVAETQFRTRSGASIVALRSGSGLEPNPGPQTILHANDVLGVLGTPEQLAAARALIEQPDLAASGS